MPYSHIHVGQFESSSHNCFSSDDRSSDDSASSAASITFQRAKEEEMEVAVHWQDADSSSAKSVREVYPDVQIMICWRSCWAST